MTVLQLLFKYILYFKGKKARALTKSPHTKSISWLGWHSGSCVQALESRKHHEAEGLTQDLYFLVGHWFFISYYSGSQQIKTIYYLLSDFTSTIRWF